MFKKTVNYPGGHFLMTWESTCGAHQGLSRSGVFSIVLECALVQSHPYGSEQRKAGVVAEQTVKSILDASGSHPCKIGNATVSSIRSAHPDTPAENHPDAMSGRWQI